MRKTSEDQEKISTLHNIRFDGECLTLHITTRVGRLCARLCAYMLLTSGEKEVAEALFEKVGY